MRHRSLLLWVCLASAGCTVVSNSAETDDAGLSGAGGSGGEAGSAGAAGQPASPCGEVPVEGRCVDNTTLERCMSSEAHDQPPQVVQGTCKGGMVCRENAGGASCELQGQCLTGTSECEGDHAVRTCVSGSWVVESCGTGVCMPGQGAACVSHAGGQSYPITGVLKYQYPPVKSDRSGYDFGNLRVEPAYAVIAAAYDGDEFIGSAYTGADENPANDGRFVIEASKAPTANTVIYFFPMYFNDNGSIQVAMAKPKTYTYSNLQSEEYWWWGVEAKTADVGTVVLTVEDGSGAMHVYQMMAYGMDRAMDEAPNVAPFNVLGLWAPEGKFDCGNGTCYVPKGWGATVSYDGGEDLYQGAVLIAGTEETPHQWSSAVILHEFGHYMMDAYSRSPHEAGPHNTTTLEKPGMAWSEGWASFYGQMTLVDPIYFDKQEGTSWWFDVSKPKASVPMPDPNGALEQDIAELAVAAMLWHLWEPGGNGKFTEESWDQADVGETMIWKAFSSSRMTKQNRGYVKVDFVDFLDSLRCEGVGEAQVSSVTGHFGFPYDQAMLCAK
jgi:hypothetical protein